MADMPPVRMFNSYNGVTASNVAPMPVQDTAEVAAAKQAFASQYRKLAELAANAPDIYQFTQDQTSTRPYAAAAAPTSVQDTYAVAAAKRAFQRQYQKLAEAGCQCS